MGLIFVSSGKFRRFFNEDFCDLVCIYFFGSFCLIGVGVVVFGFDVCVGCIFYCWLMSNVVVVGVLYFVMGYECEWSFF